MSPMAKIPPLSSPSSSAFQETANVVLGGVSPSLDKVIAIDIDSLDIWAACKLVRETVGGYLYVDFDPADPLTRRLWLSDNLGENKGQQVRLGKNLTGINYTTDYIDFCNRLYPVGGSALKLDSKTFSRVDADKSSDATYGYLKLQGLYAAYKGWTAAGAALPETVTIETPTGSFVSPTGYEESTGWIDPANAYDANDATYTYHYNWWQQTWTPWLTLTHAAVAATQIKWFNEFIFIDLFQVSPVVQIDIYYGGAWRNVFNGTAAADWVVTTFAQQTITKVRMRLFNGQFLPMPAPQNTSCRIRDIYIWDATGWTNVTSVWKQGADERTFRCAIADYVIGAGYVVSYTHAPYLIALDDITARDEIFSKSLSFTASNVDALLEMGRTKLTESKTPIISIDVALVDLSAEEGNEFEELELGSIIRIIDEGLDIDTSARVVRLQKTDLLNPGQITIEIANKVKDIIDVI